MKKLKTRNEYVGCNNECRYYADENKATSYGWWNFVLEIDGMIIFNDFKYSNTTSRHQGEVDFLMYELGLKRDFTVYMRQSLTKSNFIEFALEYFYEVAIKAIVTRNTPRVRKSTKEYCAQRLEWARKNISKLKAMGCKYTFKKLMSEYRWLKNRKDEKELTLKTYKKVKTKIFKKNKTQDLFQVTGKGERTLVLEEVTKNKRKKTYNYPIDIFIKEFRENKLANALGGS